MLQKLTIAPPIVLLQVIALVYASEQKVVGNNGAKDAVATPDAALELNDVQGGWTPYQNGTTCTYMRPRRLMRMEFG